jgi:chemotaxis protein methyltransferase CheR
MIPAEPLAPLSTHTHFFRGEEELEAAVEIVAQRAAAGRLPRIWCAGCSTGAEPYTLAILCRERGVDAAIHATDINAAALDAARRARFPELSLRRAPPHLRDRYFVREGSEFVVAPEIVRRVTFEESDLRCDPLPLRSSHPQEIGWGVIVCRNVLIYYEPEMAGVIAARLATALRSDGVLVVGASDPLAFRSVAALRSVSVRGVAAYMRAEGYHGAEVATAPSVSVPAPSVPPPPVSIPRSRPFFLPEAGLPGPEISVSHAAEDDLGGLLLSACAHLAEHAWGDAERELLHAMEIAPLAMEPPLYLGVLRRKQGRFDEAVEHLRRAVFLAPSCWLAAYLLAGAWERAGDRARACMELARALAALESPSGAPPAPLGADVAGLVLDPEEVARACRSRLGP